MKTGLLRSILYWLPMPLIGIINGTFRQVVLLQYFSEMAARQVSSLSLIILLVLYVAFIFPRLQIRHVSTAWQVGILWVFLTLAFEFGLGFFILHNSMASMLGEYNITAGKFWVFIPLSILLLPVMFFKFRSHK